MRDLVRILELNTDFVPAILGPLHITAMIIAVLLSLFVGIYFRGKKDLSTYKKIMFTLGVFFIFTEIWKIFIMSFPSNGEHYFRLREFPLQLSSLPMPVMVIASLTVKKERVHQTLNYFMATYLMIGGISAVVSPATLFRSPLFIPLHSLTLHTAMLLVGIYLYTAGFAKFEFKSYWFKRAVMLFLAYVVVSQALNIGSVLLGIYTPGTNGIGRMYVSGGYVGNFLILGHVSPWHISTIPIAREVQLFILNQFDHLAAAYIGAITAYILATTAAAYVFFMISSLVGHLYNKMLPIAVQKNINQKKPSI